MITEGSKVSYAGAPTQFLAQGDVGQVLGFANAHTVHTMWATGAMAGQTTMEAIEDLAGTQRTAGLVEDSLEYGPLMRIAARDIFDASGEVGLLNQMAAEGHLASFASIAEDVLAEVSSRLRAEASFREVLSQLDETEGESLVRTASLALIRDAFGEE